MNVEIEYTITGKITVPADVYQELLDDEDSEKQLKDMSVEELKKFINEVEEENCFEAIFDDASENGKAELTPKLVE